MHSRQAANWPVTPSASRSGWTSSKCTTPGEALPAMPTSMRGPPLPVEQLLCGGDRPRM